MSLKCLAWLGPHRGGVGGSCGGNLYPRVTHTLQKLGGERYCKLGALSLLLARKTDGAEYVTSITREANQKQNMTRIQKYNRRLERFLGLSASSDPEKPISVAPKDHPSYEVRQFLNKLHDILTKYWGICDAHPFHQAKLRLATFGSKKHKNSNREVLQSRDFDLLLRAYDIPARWKQSRTTFHR